jgi:Flp pilus assembly protein TadD
VVLVLGAMAIAVDWVAHREVNEAGRSWEADLARAYERIDRARDLDPLDARPSVIEGVIAAEAGDLSRARVAFRRAADREPRDWFARFELGLAESALGRRGRASAALRAAKSRNPRETLIDDARRRLDSPRPLSLDEARATFRGRVAQRLGRSR